MNLLLTPLFGLTLCAAALFLAALSNLLHNIKTSGPIATVGWN